MTSDASSELVFDENKLISREVSLHRNKEKYRGVYCFNKKKKVRANTEQKRNGKSKDSKL